MKKLITKYWGLVLVVVLLSSLFVGAAPVSAANYEWSDALVVPVSTYGLLAPSADFGIVAVAQSGSTIYALGYKTTATTNSLYKSTDGGATWAAKTTGIDNVAGTNRWTLIAVAPDDPNLVVVIDTGTTDAVWVSTTGGTLFSKLIASTTVVNINSITVSPLGTYRYLAIGGNDNAGAGKVATWTMGLVSPSWTDKAHPGTPSDVFAVAFSPNYAADNSLLTISNNGSFDTVASVYSFNLLAWNPSGYDFPRTIIDNSGAATAITKAEFALDTNFYLGDISQQVGFISIASTNATAGGVYRFEPTGAISQPYATQSVNNVAWDGTNLMVAPYDTTAGAAISILRCANALGIVPTFIPSTTVKTPGTGTLPLVMFNGGNAYAFSAGKNSAIAKSTDLGKSFNGFALVNSNFNNVLDFWISPDGARMYAVVDDGTDINLWRRTGTVWERIFILAAATTETWLVRADAGAPDTVILGKKGATLMYKSVDAGQATWTIRGAAAAIADFAIQDANTIYQVTSANSYVYKSVTGAFTWTPIIPLYLNYFGVGYSINLLADNSILVGTTGGGVAYSNDGATFNTLFSATDGLTAGNTVVTATGTAAGDTIFVGTNNGAGSGMLAKWVIGTSANWNTTNVFAPPMTAEITGIAYGNGLLYAVNDTANATYRFLTPTITISAASDTKTLTATTDQTNMVNALQLTNGSNVLWTRNSFTTIDSIMSLTDPMIGAASIPTPTAPINNAIIPVNSLTGAPNTFNFMFNVPSAALATWGYGFNVMVYLDEAGTIAAAGTSLTAVVADYSYVTGVVTNTTVFSGATPGATYYWKVRVATGKPELGPWSAMQSFSVQQLQAIVPILTAPMNGSSLEFGRTAAFSWNPIAGASSYTFQLSTDPSFATTLYTTTATAAGISVPSTVTIVPGTTYYWRVKVLTPAAGEWSTVANFYAAEKIVVVVPVTTPPAPVVTPTFTVNVPAPPAATTITIPPNTTVTNEVNPSYIWAIIIIGAVLVIAVIVLIVRTRRSV